MPPPPPPDAPRRLAVAQVQSFALGADGGVYSWGHGLCGVLGHGGEERQYTPRRIDSLAARAGAVVGVSAGRDHTVAVAADGRVWAWGRADSGQLGHGRPTAVADVPRWAHDERRGSAAAAADLGGDAGQRAPADADAATRSAGDQISSGRYAGDGGAGGRRHSAGSATERPRGAHATAAAAGDGTADARRREGAADCGACDGAHAGGVSASAGGGGGAHGGGGGGGDGCDSSAPAVLELLPRRVDSLAAVRVVSASAGRSHTLLLAADGSVYACGCAEGGRLGLGRPRWCKAAVALPSVFRPARLEPFVGRGPAPSAGRLDGGGVVPLSPPPAVIAISAGAEHSLFLDARGAVYACGRGTHGALGQGGNAGREPGEAQLPPDCEVPTRVEALADSGVFALGVCAGAACSIVEVRSGSGAPGSGAPQQQVPSGGGGSASRRDGGGGDSGGGRHGGFLSFGSAELAALGHAEATAAGAAAGASPTDGAAHAPADDQAVARTAAAAAAKPLLTAAEDARAAVRGPAPVVLPAWPVT